MMLIKNISVIGFVYVILFCVEFYLFKTHVLHNITSFYPTNFDQSSFLPNTYMTFENIKHFGLIAGMKKTPLLATGMMFPIQAVFFYLIFGASRLVALLPNFIYFILLQLFALIAVRSLSQKNYLAFILLGLILSVKTPFLNAGGLMDFRIDFIAFCLYGIFLCSTIKSNFFLDKKWSLITTLFATLLILFRCITIVYLLSILGLMIGYLSLTYTQNKLRLKNLLMVTLFISALALIYLWLNRTALFNYYVIGHVLGSEKNIRATEVGITDIFSFLLFYPTSLFVYHIGKLCISLSIALLFAFSLFFYLSKSSYENSLIKKDIPWKLGYIFFLFCLLIPLITLTLDVNKSGVVGGIMVLPCIWLVMWTCLLIDSKQSQTALKLRFFNFMGYSLLILGLWNQLSELHHHKSKTQLNNLQAITKMYQDIGDYALLHDWPEIRLSVDQICDYLTSGGIETVYYENNHKLIPVNINRMGGAIFSINKDEAILSMKNSNVIIMNLNDYPHSPYPYNQSMNTLKPFLIHFADKHFSRLGDYQFMNSTYRVFVAKTLAL